MDKSFLVLFFKKELLPFFLIALPLSAQAAPPVCITSYRIDHTEVPNDNAILFYMRDRSVYRAAVDGHCIGLSLDNRGFTYAPTPGSDEICANLLTIRLNTSGAICMIGDITRIRGPGNG